ncbi:MAG: fibronectin type III domain-containing protein [Candidatus Acidiferrales bacterium]
MENRNGFPPSQVPHTNIALSPIFHFLISIFAFAFLTAGCAAPGEPIERRPRVPTPVADLTAVQQGDDVLLSFTLPKESVDRRPLKQPPAVEIYRDFAPAASSSAANASTPPGAPANPTPLVTIPSAMVDQYDDRGHFRYLDSLKPEDFTQHPAAQAIYIVRTRASTKRASADSNVAALRVEPAADPITDLRAEVTHQGIVLSWTPPQKTLTGSVPPIASYRIYRSEPESQVQSASLNAPKENSKANSPPVRIGDASAPPFRDSQIKFGNTYTYSVRSVAQYQDAQPPSADSNLVTVTPRDTFPPAAPQGLVVVFVPAHNAAVAYFDLSWSINAENDIAGYNIYRSEQEGTPGNKLNPQLLLTPAFRDMNVVPGQRYFYTVTAVDRSGNESPASAAASGEMPAVIPD